MQTKCFSLFVTNISPLAKQIPAISRSNSSMILPCFRSSVLSSPYFSRAVMSKLMISTSEIKLRSLSRLCLTRSELYAPKKSSAMLMVETLISSGDRAESFSLILGLPFNQAMQMLVSSKYFTIGDSFV